MRKYLVNDNYFDIIDDEKAWLIGLLAADGYIKERKGYYIEIGQSGKEGLRLIKYIKKILKFTGPIRVEKNPKNHKLHYRISICSTPLAEQLKKFNIISKKSLIYEFPEKILPYFNSFIRGYIDGDGCVGIYKNHNKTILCIDFVGTESFIHSCGKLINPQGVIRKRKISKNLSEIRWFSKKAILVGNEIFKNKKLFKSYKSKKFFSYKKD